MNRKSKKLFLLVLTVAVVLIAAGCQTTPKAEEQSPAPVAEEENMIPLNMTTLSGVETDFANYFSRAELTVVHVWETSCAECVDEMKVFASLSKEYTGKGVQFFGIVNESKDADHKDAVTAAETAGASYVQFLNSSEWKDQYMDGSDSVPAILFIDKNGNLLGMSEDSEKTETQWREEIEKYHQTTCTGDHPAERSSVG